MADFQRELEARWRTIASDLDFLRMEENAPIAFDPKGRGYRLTHESFALPPVGLSQGDLANLAAARAALGAWGTATSGSRIQTACCLKAPPIADPASGGSESGVGAPPRRDSAAAVQSSYKPEAKYGS